MAPIRPKRLSPPAQPETTAWPLSTATTLGASAKTSEQHAPSQFDGKIFGAHGRVYDSHTPLNDVPGTRPQPGTQPPRGMEEHYGREGKMFFVNGVQNLPEDLLASVQALADRTGSEVVGIYNAADPHAGDRERVFDDKLGMAGTPATHTLAKGIYAELEGGRSPHLVAHGQGVNITSNALTAVRQQLIREGRSPAEAEKALSSIKVETYGSTAKRFPDGPKYLHYMNLSDFIAADVGGPHHLFGHAGRGARLHTFDSGWPLISHGFANPYLTERTPFDPAYSAPER
ncbi:hypothetical protein MYSTI_02594 [Myxococcus stipitatus DSM 14675]|uniref:Uncharacterized protein n=1 Tax=Myxococcus stipitatus (strain DSM 14675 / JCM 12634 / Mx s8) TaxID=1278073 RepID=L7U7Y3_MYXSD|nr:hypothetical protein [Myxococcus stipitatus]AGC43910.1 hypothetical protein MYSTI_02594 [Myxococcus stipitatus DSM 14675]